MTQPRTAQPDPGRIDWDTVGTVVFSYSVLSHPTATVRTTPGDSSERAIRELFNDHEVPVPRASLEMFGQQLRERSAHPHQGAVPELLRWMLDLYAPDRTDLDPRRLAEDLFARTADTRVSDQAAVLVRDLLTAGLRVVVATNTLRPRRQRRESLDRAGLHTADLVVSSDLAWAKPDDRFYMHVRDLVGGDPARVLWVGADEIRDVLGPIRSGMPAVLITTQAAPRRGVDLNTLWNRLLHPPSPLPAGGAL